MIGEKMGIVKFSCVSPQTHSISVWGTRRGPASNFNFKRENMTLNYRIAVNLIVAVLLATLVGCGGPGTDPAAVDRLKKAGLIVLAQNKEAYGLNTARQAITAETAADIAKLGDLKNLDFTASDMTDEIFTTAVQNFKPVSVVLNDTKLTAKGLSAISGSRVEAIFLRNTAVGDEALSVIGKLSTLTELNLDGTQITNAGLSDLSGLSNLKRLIINNTSIDDAGLMNLKSLTTLAKIDAKGSSITPDGAKALSDAIPGLLIEQ